jgi:glutaredoxin
MKIIRTILGAIILFFDWLTSPKGIKRDAETQAVLDSQTSKLALYQYKACPFCVKVRRVMKRHSLNIETRDPKRCDSARQELIAGSGKLKVPCLRIEDDEGDVNWMFESKDIIGYLEARVLASTAH